MVAVRRCERYALITELNDEWARLVVRHRVQLRWAAQPELAACRDLAEVIAAIRHRPDPVLGALLAETAAGDTLAGRAVLQAMLGKVVRMAQTDPDLGVEEFLSALWCRIRTYPLARRPTKIAANLALDTRKDVLGRARLGQLEQPSGSLTGADWDRLLRRRTDRDGCRHDSDEVNARHIIELGEDMGMIDAATSAVLRAVYVDGASSRTAAARLGTSPGMIRYRCSRGLRELARHATTLREAA